MSSLATELAGGRGRLSAIEAALTAARVHTAALEQKIAAQAARQEIEARLRPIAKAAKRVPTVSKGMASALRRKLRFGV